MLGMKSHRGKGDRGKNAAVTLKSVAECVGLTASTVSAVLNNSSASQSVPERTKKRILAAARDLNYRPNFFARSLRVSVRTRSECFWRKSAMLTALS